MVIPKATVPQFALPKRTSQAKATRALSAPPKKRRGAVPAKFFGEAVAKAATALTRAPSGAGAPVREPPRRTWHSDRSAVAHARTRPYSRRADVRHQPRRRHRAPRRPSLSIQATQAHSDAARLAVASGRATTPVAPGYPAPTRCPRWRSARWSSTRSNPSARLCRKRRRKFLRQPRRRRLSARPMAARTWAVLARRPFLGVGFYDLVIDPATPSTLYAATTNGFFKSTNSGSDVEPETGR